MCVTIGNVSAQHQQQYTTPVPILKQINRQNEDGSYSFGYEAADKSFKIETKYPNGEVYGKYGYVDDTGKVREVEYGASNRGFEPQGKLLYFIHLNGFRNHNIFIKPSIIFQFIIHLSDTKTASHTHPHQTRALSENIDNVIDNFLLIENQPITTINSDETPIDRGDLAAPFAWLDKHGSTTSASESKDKDKKSCGNSLKFKLCSKNKPGFGEICLEITKTLEA